jgi:hypothetical protein
MNSAPAPAGTARPRPRWVALAGALAIVAAVAVVAVVVGLGLFSIGTCACSAAPPPSSPIDGVVVGVDSEGLGRIRSFSLLSAGTTYELQLGDLENAPEFSPSHLSEHLASSEPIRAWFRVTGGVEVVFRLEDAPEVVPAAT